MKKSLIGLILILVFLCVETKAAIHRTPNFITHAPTLEIAQRCGNQAEKYRDILALRWLQTKLPKWYKPCPLTIESWKVGAGGETRFWFDNGEVTDWTMRVQGSLEDIIESVIPHEVSHTIFACYFRRPLPRWADEGAATTAESESERRKYTLTLKQAYSNKSLIPLSELLVMMQYPSDGNKVLVLYAQGYSITDYLLQQKSHKEFLRFITLSKQQGSGSALKIVYQIESVKHLQAEWIDWVAHESPPIGTNLEENLR